MNISSEPELITPELASQWLGNNVGNRQLKPAHVRFLADQILTGQWQVTPDTIKLSTSGRVLDGQHRLSAIVESGVAQPMYVARDCAEEIFTVLDTGKARSASDVIAISGVKNATHLASIARLILLHQAGKLGQLKSKNRNATNGEILALCQEINLEPVAAAAVNYYSQSRLLSVSEYGFLHWLFSARSESDTKKFLDKLTTAVGLTADSPVLLLRRKLEQARNGDRFKFTPIERLALSIKAWNLFRQKKTAGILTYNPEKEPFPEAI